MWYFVAKVPHGLGSASGFTKKTILQGTGGNKKKL
jgi:hypothetical protein